MTWPLAPSWGWRRAGSDPCALEVDVVVLTDRLGRVLMQHRTADAPISPNLWTPPGGGIEPGEDAVEAAHRELFEETGLRCSELVLEQVLVETSDDGKAVRFHIFTGRTEASGRDIVLGEGQAMVFLTLEEIWQRELTLIAKAILPSPPDLGFGGSLSVGSWCGRRAG
jgi:8-oxo-dGTP diphosphatase